MNGMKLSVKLALGFTSLLIIILIMVVFSFNSIIQIQANLKDIINLNVYKLNLISDLVKQIYVESEATQTLILTNDPVQRKLIQKNINDARKKIDEDWEDMTKTATTEKGQALRDQFEEKRSLCRSLNNQVIELAKADKSIEATELFIQKVVPVVNEWKKNTEDAVVLQKVLNSSSYEKAMRTSNNTLLVLIIFSVFAIGLGIFVTFFVTRSVANPINRIVNNLNSSAQQVASASEQLSASAQQLSEGSSEQASSIEETSASLEETASMLQQNNGNTRQAVQLSEHTMEFADKGNREMQEMMDSMEEIKNSSDQIAKIVKVIDDIAFQTNILALNAAIEAARAGESGLGFAVVAEEVRNLAQRSAQAAKNTTDIIQSNIQLSGRGVQVAERVRDALNEITAQARKVRDLMEEIAAASQEQSHGIEQVNRAMEQIEAITQINASNSEESAAAAEELNAQAESMKKMFNELSQLIHGATHVQKANLQFATTHEIHHPGHHISLSDNVASAKETIPENVIPLEKDPHHF